MYKYSSAPSDFAYVQSNARLIIQPGRTFHPFGSHISLTLLIYLLGPCLTSPFSLMA